MRYSRVVVGRFDIAGHCVSLVPLWRLFMRFWLPSWVSSESIAWLWNFQKRHLLPVHFNFNCKNELVDISSHNQPSHWEVYYIERCKKQWQNPCECAHLGRHPPPVLEFRGRDSQPFLIIASLSLNSHYYLTHMLLWFEVAQCRRIFIKSEHSVNDWSQLSSSNKTVHLLETEIGSLYGSSYDGTKM